MSIRAETYTLQTKQCSKCKEEKPLSEFSKNKRTKDGYHFYCKDCKKADWEKFKSKRATEDKVFIIHTTYEFSVYFHVIAKTEWGVRSKIKKAIKEFGGLNENPEVFVRIDGDDMGDLMAIQEVKEDCEARFEDVTPYLLQETEGEEE